nr:alpha/beta hydrolase [Kribbella sandramycini]
MIILGIVLALLGAGVVVTLVGNDYRLRTRELTIPVPGGTLAAVLATPEGEPARGLVVMVHGDGPVEATHDGLYLPWFEAAGDAGFATLSWSKPGIGGSTGNWLAQSMADRASEVSQVLEWARGQSEIPAGPVVLWGASQAGWVLPKVRADAVVAVSPAINWLRQGRFNLLAELDHEKASADERARAIAVSDQTRALLQQNADYDTYRAKTTDPEPMAADRWAFVRRNYTADATADLQALKIPVHLMLGEHDRNVDIAETASTYQRLLGDRLTVRRFAAAHSMARPDVADSELLGLATAVLWPRAVFAPGVLDDYRATLRAL